MGKLLFLNVSTGTAVEPPYVFPNDVASHTGSQLNDLVLDVVSGVAYISDSAPPPFNSDLGGLIVYDRRRRRSRRFEDPSTHAESGFEIKIHGWGFPWCSILQQVPTDGIALHPARDRLFYTKNGGAKLWSLDAVSLRNFSRPLSAVSSTVVDHGKKPSNSDGMAFGSDGALYHSGLTTDTVYRLSDLKGNPGTDSEVVAMDHVALWWPDTFAFDNAGYLWVTSNRIESFLFPPYRMDFSGRNGPNFHIVKIPVGTNSYLLGQKQP